MRWGQLCVNGLVGQPLLPTCAVRSRALIFPRFMLLSLWVCGVRGQAPCACRVALLWLLTGHSRRVDLRCREWGTVESSARRSSPSRSPGKRPRTSGPHLV